ncbi:MAG: NB-ARC domain-containing protein [Chloroflexi bacterium]|nr:NB-ARC domain-containing protein [Chloroflexota bacterium]
MSDLRVYLLGGPRIEFKEDQIKIARRKAIALVAFLAMTRQPQERSIVADLLWPELDYDHARSALRSTLYALTTDIPVAWLDAERLTLALNQDEVWVDVSEFLDLVAYRCPEQHPGEQICDKCLEFHLRAADLYGGDFLGHFSLPDNNEFYDWLLGEQEWLRREYSGIQRRLSQYYAEHSQVEAAVKHALLWLEQDELHEPAHRWLMRLYFDNGQRTEAIRQYQQCEEILDTELASPPETETIQLYENIKNNQAGPLPLEQPVPNQISSSLPPLPSLVIGRDEALQDIRQRLDVVRPVTVIQGWPGVGKSTLLGAIAHDREVAGQFPDGVLWASLGEAPDIPGELNLWADALSLSEPGRARGADEISALIRAMLRDKRVLILVDDVWETEHAAPFKVGGQSCATIMTTRLNDVAGALAPTAGDVYRLSVLSEAAGFELISKLAPETVSQYPVETRQLVNDLEGLPLAIHVAGRLLHSEARLGWGIGDLLEELRTGAALLAAKPPGDMIGGSAEMVPTVAALLKRSTGSLDDETRTRFALLGLFIPKPATFDLAAMAALWDVDDPKSSARKLVDRGLLEPVSGGRFQMHALLVLHARTLLDSSVKG